MPRRQFRADLSNAVQGVAIAGVSNVQPGNDDGEFTFICLAESLQLRISVLIPELSDYPSAHECIIFGADNASASVAAALSDIAGAASGKTIVQIMEVVSSRLESMDRDGDRQMLNSQDFEELDDTDDEVDEYFPGDEDLNSRPAISQYYSAAGGGCTVATSAFRQRVREDILTAKKEGFRIGHLGGLIDGMACYLSVSIRISKLGLSEEAMQAWQLKPSEYLVAIVHYPNGYKSMDDIKSLDAVKSRRNFGIRVGISTFYKPTVQEAIASFAMLREEIDNRPRNSQQSDSQNSSAPTGGFRNSFISGPLNDMMEQRFHMLVKYRHSGMLWHGAEAFYNDQIHTTEHLAQESADDKYYKEDRTGDAWPRLVTNDHITSSYGQQHSLPLVVMQFVLRHFVRCTEFCLICFNKMPEDLQAIKPYVCENPLCLYQYMSLGFGPSIEHEILSQPKVVDLLISFCYVSARMGRLKDFPTGLSLSVPPTVAIGSNYMPFAPSRYSISQPPKQSSDPPTSVEKHKATSTRFCEKRLELLFDDSTRPCPVKNGQWIALRVEDSLRTILHCRIIDASCHPTVRVSEPIRPATLEDAHNPYGSNHTEQAGSSKPRPFAKEGLLAASFHVYTENFDNLVEDQKRQAIAALLDLLPAVREMKAYLLRKAQSPLSAWVDRLPPAALGVLRWIIASNRACIVQVDSDDNTVGGRDQQNRLYGMAGWAQFRFAMGAPDKERRFIAAVRETTTRLNLKYSTLFAWHGSPTQNWHSIIREGLHFNDTLHGRAYGNGVYHAPNVTTSLGYSQMGSHALWSTSELKIQQVLALNEIVNAPAEFVSQNPHLVVAQLDWIQTRYLFVKTRTDTGSTAPDPGIKPMEFVEQDPKRTPNGINGPLVIPIHAIAASRGTRLEAKQKKRQKMTGANRFDPTTIDDEDEVSDSTDDEDLAIFEDDDPIPQQAPDLLPTPNSDIDGKGKAKMGSLASFGNKLFGSKSTASSVPLIDYIPGSLDYTTLPMLEMSAWASSGATSRLMRDFKDLIQVQNKEPLHELGWHIDEDKIENMYQWIIELHSFESTLPLAKDMKAKHIKSIVLEIRFGKDYPMSPPFVRVIRPRFLTFMEGGGGHVTSGGAMCMELLTNDGWSAVSSIESVLLQVRMAISSLDPRPARLSLRGPGDYGVGEAVEAYMRACSVHGWTVPPGFREMAFGAADESLDSLGGRSV